MSTGSAALEALFRETQEGGLPSALDRKQAIQKVNYSHDAMIDLIIVNPGIHQNDLAAKFGYSAAWISNVMASDAFQARLAERREEVIDPVLKATIEERVKGMCLQALEVIQRKLETAPSDNLALRAFELGAKSMGLGGNAPPKPVQIDLSALAERLTALNPNRTPPTPLPQEKEIEGVVLGKETS